MSKEPIVDRDACTTSANAEYVAFVSKTFDELKELFIAKNLQYGSGEPLEFEAGSYSRRSWSVP